MFDPTIFDNLKVVIEGAVYDLDEVGAILVTDRTDRVELATMSRYYSIQFREKDEAAGDAQAEIRLYADREDLEAEIMEQKDKFPGCRLEIFFLKKVNNVEKECSSIQELLTEIWQNRPRIEQTVCYPFHVVSPAYTAHIRLDFGRKISEEQIEDMEMLIDHTLHSIQRMNQMNMKET